MIHTWLTYLDPPGRNLRLCFLDISKAFNRIGYNVLIEKLLDLGVRTSLIPWIISFLSNRRQRVKLAGSISDWLPINAGVPQGTKLGPILFLVMISNLSISDPESCTWKYVDDVSLSEGLVRNSISTIQTSLNTVASWSSSNWMKLNAKKCKEMRICFLKDPTEFPHLKIDEQQLELVTSHKVLVLVIQNNLKWNNHIESIVTKASKGGEIRDTKTLNLSRNIVSLQILVDVSRFSPCVINLTRSKNIFCGLKKCRVMIG